MPDIQKTNNKKIIYEAFMAVLSLVMVIAIIIKDNGCLF